MTIVARLQRTGIRRRGTPRTRFRYVARRGRLTADDRRRIERLRVPPGWRDVAISASPTSSVQAVGKDAAGRWQYLYHQAHVRRREEKKFERMLAFGHALPALRRTVQRDLRGGGLGRRSVLACMVRILSAAFLRPGSEHYAAENGTFGIATLRKRHVSVRGGVVRFEFPAKAGKLHVSEVRDRRVAQIVARLLALPGREVFAFVAEDGTRVDVKRSHLNAYLKEAMGRRFSAKDFRTWAGTLICACALGKAGCADGESKAARRRKVVEAVRTTAQSLGNTPAVCRASYVSPRVVERFAEGRVIDARFESVARLVASDGAALRRCEKALLALLSGASPVGESSRRAA